MPRGAAEGREPALALDVVAELRDAGLWDEERERATRAAGGSWGIGPSPSSAEPQGAERAADGVSDGTYSVVCRSVNIIHPI